MQTDIQRPLAGDLSTRRADDDRRRCLTLGGRTAGLSGRRCVGRCMPAAGRAHVPTPPVVDQRHRPRADLAAVHVLRGEAAPAPLVLQLVEPRSRSRNGRGRAVRSPRCRSSRWWPHRYSQTCALSRTSSCGSAQNEQFVVVAVAALLARQRKVARSNSATSCRSRTSARSCDRSSVAEGRAHVPIGEAQPVDAWGMTAPRATGQHCSRFEGYASPVSLPTSRIGRPCHSKRTKQKGPGFLQGPSY